MPMTPPPPGAVDADDLEHVGAGALEWLARARVGPDRQDPARSASQARLRDAERGPPAADDLPGRSDGERDVVAGRDDGDGGAHPRPDLRRRRDGTGGPLAWLERRSRRGGGRMREVAARVHRADERGEGCRRPGDLDPGGRGRTARGRRARGRARNALRRRAVRRGGWGGRARTEGDRGHRSEAPRARCERPARARRTAYVVGARAAGGSGHGSHRPTVDDPFTRGGSRPDEDDDPLSGRDRGRRRGRGPMVPDPFGRSVRLRACQRSVPVSPASG